jgi:hypothetical protein
MKEGMERGRHRKPCSITLGGIDVSVLQQCLTNALSSCSKMQTCRQNARLDFHTSAIIITILYTIFNVTTNWKYMPEH